MKLLFTVLVVVCLVGCKDTKEEQYGYCIEYETELYRHNLELQQHHYVLVKSLWTIDENDSVTINAISRKIAESNSVLDSMQAVISNVRDSCHNITCVLNKQK